MYYKNQYTQHIRQQQEQKLKLLLLNFKEKHKTTINLWRINFIIYKRTIHLQQLHSIITFILKSSST